MNSEYTVASAQEDALLDPKAILRRVYEALSEKGYNPIGQIVGYLLSEDPTYITNTENARALIRKIDRDQLMRELVKNYLELEEPNDPS